MSRAELLDFLEVEYLPFLGLFLDARDHGRATRSPIAEVRSSLDFLRETIPAARRNNAIGNISYRAILEIAADLNRILPRLLDSLPPHYRLKFDALYERLPEQLAARRQERPASSR